MQRRWKIYQKLQIAQPLPRIHASSNYKSVLHMQSYCSANTNHFLSFFFFDEHSMIYPSMIGLVFKFQYVQFYNRAKLRPRSYSFEQGPGLFSCVKSGFRPIS